MALLKPHPALPNHAENVKQDQPAHSRCLILVCTLCCSFIESSVQNSHLLPFNQIESVNVTFINLNLAVIWVNLAGQRLT